MASNFDKLQAEAMALAPAERAELAERLWTTLEPQADISVAWDEEIARRVVDLEAGRTTSIPAEQVLAEIRAMIAGHDKR